MYKKSITGLTFIGVGRIVPSAVMALFFIIFATILDTENYGTLGYVFSIAVTATVISGFGLPQSIVVYAAKKNESVVNQLNSIAILTMSVASIILIFVIPITALLCIGFSLFLLYQHNLLGTQNYKGYMKNALIRSILVFAIPLPLYFLYGIDGILIGMALGNIFVSISFLKSFKFNLYSFNLLKSNYRVLLSNFGVDSANNLVRTIDKILIGYVFGYSTLGLYYFNMQILTAMELIPRSLYLFLLSDGSNSEQNKKISFLIIITSALIAIVTIFIAPFVIGQLFPNFSDGILSLQILVVSIIPLSISSILYAKMQSSESTIVGFSGIIRIGTLIIFIFTLGAYFELVGMSLAVLFSSTINLVFLLILYRFFLKIKDKS